MKLTDAISRLKIDLSLLDETVMEEQEKIDCLGRGVIRAVSDLSRFIPREMEHEITLVFTISGEAWTAASAAGTWVTLANKPIKYASETVLNNAGTTCTRDTDYTMDYAHGKITHISGGAIANDEVCSISYEKSKITVDISDIEDLMRVDRVEYPLGNIPQSFVNYEVRGDFLTVQGGSATQASMSAGKHMLIFYKTKHTPPTDSAEGSYPDFLDDTVILAASAYVMFTLVDKFIALGYADLSAAQTELEAITHTAIGTALSNSGTQLTAAATALANVGTRITSAVSMITTGSGKVDTVNEGVRVPENFANLAAQEIDGALAYVEEATQRVNSGGGYQNEASARITEIDRYLNESSIGRCQDESLNNRCMDSLLIQRYLDLLLINRYQIFV